jgi:twitching motility protein PilT
MGVCSQRLVPGAHGGRILNTEVLINSSRVRDMISKNVPHKELHDAIVDGDYYGMHSFDQRLVEQVNSGDVKLEDALTYATDPHDFKIALKMAPASANGE